jgi:serine/threonine protein kinase
LRHILLSPDPETSLSGRFRLAQQLAQAVSYVHTYGFVHKGIRPDTILVFEDEKETLAASFLVGFENMRTEKGRTLKAGDSVWEKDIYRHPLRQGLKPEVAYIMQHDIYSLGVCLLEIGLWKSFVLYQTEAMPSHPLPPFINEDGEEIAKATRVKDALVGLAREKLPGRMGDKYTEVVINCLTCLDDDNIDFGNESEFQDGDGILIGVRYIEKVSYPCNCLQNPTQVC